MNFFLNPTGYTNYFFDALVNVSDFGFPEITCQFLNGPVSFATCAITYGIDQNFTKLANSTSANDMNTSAVTLQLTELQPNTEYYYIVLAIGDSMRAQIQGTFITGMHLIAGIRLYKKHLLTYFFGMGNLAQRELCCVLFIRTYV